MSEMVDTVAQKLRDSMPGLIHPDAWPWETMAIAAIRAMREPTFEMMKRGEKAGWNSAKLLWEEMIDEALK